MRLLINIIPNETIDWDRLLQLSADINQQRPAGVVANLQLDAASLTAAQRDQLVALHVTIQPQPDLISGSDSYVLNLRENDVLFPGAVAQWTSVTAMHPQTPVSLATFDNQLPLDEQVADYVTMHADSLLLTTYAHLTDSDNVWPKLWGLQSYSLQTNLTNSKLMSQRLRPTGVLLPVDQLSTAYPVASLAQNLQLLSQQAEIIRLHVPTIQNGLWGRDTPLAWLDQLQAGRTVPLDIKWQLAFERYFKWQLKKLDNPENHVELTDEQLQRLHEAIERATPVDPETEA